MSSTVVSSLTTGVPVVADEAVLGAYTFLPREAVLEMRKGEDEVDAMIRVGVREEGGRRWGGAVGASHRRPGGVMRLTRTGGQGIGTIDRRQR
jgi:hypothetical protein